MCSRQRPPRVDLARKTTGHVFALRLRRRRIRIYSNLFVASHAITMSPSMITIVGRLQAEMHRSALPKAARGDYRLRCTAPRCRKPPGCSLRRTAPRCLGDPLLYHAVWCAARLLCLTDVQPLNLCCSHTSCFCPCSLYVFLQTNTQGRTTVHTTGQMQAEKHRSFLPNAPLQESRTRAHTMR